jgi:hypothetical protein
MWGLRFSVSDMELPMFNMNSKPIFLQVIHRVASSIHMWSYLLQLEQRGPMDIGCNRLMTVVRAIFSQGCWLHTNRIEDA